MTGRTTYYPYLFVANYSKPSFFIFLEKKTSAQESYLFRGYIRIFWTVYFTDFQEFKWCTYVRGSKVFVVAIASCGLSMFVHCV